MRVEFIDPACRANRWPFKVRYPTLYELPAKGSPHIEVNRIVGLWDEEVLDLGGKGFSEWVDEIFTNLITAWAKARADTNKNV
jgi:hypothetical protein